ncbi:TPA: hypothetical protein PXO06_001103 [Yersinia enterocolitica]|uniref:hypothetical protein n=1 Tax=Yersinia enterocolitica TaxID=630 RepID=UPI0005DE3235|nr:hypothetical protein [Yersinia enterocolitica]QCW23347.1 hypothetical protein [Yersinia phage YeP1]QCW23408.1 hypothetical protein [Yersinia phage YeP2]HDS3335791.1 hypothetical protein [Yersinia enterocolitica subsp. palearctica]EKN4723984.1 hypothetical protein [Yersinia enterocolitica]EKN4735024.1 hypothetical protein [Yersinia enterocolitica]
MIQFLTILSLIVGLIGAALLSYGAWLILPAMGFSVAGGLCLTWSYLVSRSVAQKTKDNDGGA